MVDDSLSEAPSQPHRFCVPVGQAWQLFEPPRQSAPDQQVQQKSSLYQFRPGSTCHVVEERCKQARDDNHDLYRLQLGPVVASVQIPSSEP